MPDAASRLTHPSQCRRGVAASSHTCDHADIRKSTEVCEAHEDTCMRNSDAAKECFMLISASHCASERAVCDMHMQQGGHMLTEEKATA